MNRDQGNGQKGATMSGQYFVQKKAVPSAKQTYDEAMARRLWEISAEMTNLHE